MYTVLHAIYEIKPISDVIFIANLNGMLRAFQPTGREFSPHHVLLELNLEAPILEIHVSRFMQVDCWFNLIIC